MWRVRALLALRSHQWLVHTPWRGGQVVGNHYCLSPISWKNHYYIIPVWHYRRNYAKKAKKKQSLLSEEEHGIVNLDRLGKDMDATVNSLKWEYTHSIITRLTPAALDHMTVEVHGKNVPLKEVAQISMPTPQTLLLNMASNPQLIEAAANTLSSSGLPLNPIQEKTLIRVPLPKMTKELRTELVKLAKQHAEKAKVSIRRIRQRGINDVRKKKEVSEDAVRRIEKHIQMMTDEYSKTVDNLLKSKSTELTKA